MKYCINVSKRCFSPQTCKTSQPFNNLKWSLPNMTVNEYIWHKSGLHYWLVTFSLMAYFCSIFVYFFGSLSYFFSSGIFLVHRSISTVRWSICLAQLSILLVHWSITLFFLSSLIVFTEKMLIWRGWLFHEENNNIYF